MMPIWPIAALLLTLASWGAIEHYRAEAHAAQLLSEQAQTEAREARANAAQWREAAGRQTVAVQAWRTAAQEAQTRAAQAREMVRQAAQQAIVEAVRVEQIAALSAPSEDCAAAWQQIEQQPPTARAP